MNEQLVIPIICKITCESRKKLLDMLIWKQLNRQLHHSFMQNKCLFYGNNFSLILAYTMQSLVGLPETYIHISGIFFRKSAKTATTHYFSI